MNYKNIYDQLISRGQQRTLEQYSEKHHILPKCLGGSNSSQNIVKLTAKEHFLAHRLLVRIYPDEYKLAYALWFMCTGSKYTKGRKIPSARVYEQVKLEMSLACKERLKISNPWKGRKHKKSSRKKQSDSAKVRKTTQINEQKRRDGISKNNQKPKSAEHTKHISEAKLGSKNPMFGKKWKLVEGKRIFY